MREVISLLEKRKEKQEKASEEGMKAQQSAEIDFEAIAAANKAKKEKMEKERIAANKSVLRSYRIKDW